MIAPDNNTSLRPNPDTPLAFLPPLLADQYMISAYLAIAVFGVSSSMWRTVFMEASEGAYLP